jgi:hypothetical protein
VKLIWLNFQPNQRPLQVLLSKRHPLPLFLIRRSKRLVDL